jgi:murein DD-endopeptidase MepM/ murein hydrolase activator NlpD
MKWLFVAVIALMAAIPSVASADAAYELYSVQAGDTLTSVAARFGVSVADIVSLNKLANPDRLTLGQSLAIPANTAGTQNKSSGSANAGNGGAATTSGNSRHLGWLGVTTRAVPIRRTPGTGTIVFNAAQGTQLVVSLEQPKFYGVVMVDGSVAWVDKGAVQIKPIELVVEPPTGVPAMVGGRPEVVREAFRYWGTRYQYGGRLPATVDCSLLAQTAFAAHGIRLPRTAAEQMRAGYPVGYAELLPGDRLYFYNSEGRIGHTAIYIGSGKFIHASASRGYVAMDDLFTTQWWRIFAGAMRI